MAQVPRAVFVHRQSALQQLINRHGTYNQGSFFLSNKGLSAKSMVAQNDTVQDALALAGASVPPHWRRGTVERGDLDRFLFDEHDVVVVVGQDGLVANVAKYLDGQPVIGVNADPGNTGVLTRHGPDAVERLLHRVEAGTAQCELRTMAEARTDDGRTLTALNEVFLGHPSHQTARYRLATPDGRTERQASSGVLVGTGTGSTGWCGSVQRERPGAPRLPGPTQDQLVWFVREAWPSPTTGTDLTQGTLDGAATLSLTVESEGLVAFGDGIEADRLVLSWGERVDIGPAGKRLRLVV
ncbi:NAD(+)/NADH kinase [Yinghuangia soli]|uniref:NAD(+)/NADH kinase n=1 Tax=Yinghuangia soli TaxID=2908204 RepID=A0AA41PUA4_9ACTN|nr:NAD(+)/NADH kinase [Yinghuangia soli]MCF2525998.1 NAD(+)/NADH kinase [Yinghuangia soli]